MPMLITSSSVLTVSGANWRGEGRLSDRRQMKYLSDTERNRFCLCCQDVCAPRSLHNEKWFSALQHASQRCTCGSKFQISLHKRFPLLLKQLAGYKTRAASFYVTCLREETHIQKKREKYLNKPMDKRSAVSSSKKCRKKCACVFTNLPPVEVLLVKDLQNISTVEAKPRLFTGNQVVMRWVVIKVTLHKCLN